MSTLPYLVGDFLPVEVDGIALDGRKIAGFEPDVSFGKNRCDVSVH